MARVKAAGWWAGVACAAVVGCMEPRVGWAPAPPQAPEAPGIDPTASAARTRVRSDLSAGLVFFLAVLPCALVTAWSLAWWTQHRKRAAAERAMDPKAPLANGFAVIVGQVELAPGESGAAVQVAITQAGREWRNKGQWSHQWTESSRATRVRPFWVRRFTGERVRVEADERIALHDDLSRVEGRSRFERVRYAELTPGETVHVTGALFGVTPSAAGHGGAYRAMATEPVLRPSRLGPMVASTERPGATSDARARFYRGWFLGALALSLALPTLVFPTVALLGLTGQTVRAHPVATRHWQVYVKPKNRPGHYVQHYGLRSVRAVDGHAQVLTDECSEAAWLCVGAGECPELRYTVSALSDDVVQIGDGAQLTDGRVAVLAMVALGLLVAFPVAAFATRPWYLRRKVVDTAQGPLPEFIARTG